jgi:hypothetical protein
VIILLFYVIKYGILVGSTYKETHRYTILLSSASGSCFVGIVRFFGDFLLACLLYLEHTVSRCCCRHCPPPPPPPSCWVYNEITLAILCLFVFLGIESLARYYSTIPFMSASFSPLWCVRVWWLYYLTIFLLFKGFYLSKKGNEKTKGFSTQNFQTH